MYRDMREKPTVCIETTVLSYLVAKPSRDLIVAAHQQTTQDWWEQAVPLLEPFVSAVVLDEVARGDELAAAERLSHMASFPVLEVVPEVLELAGAYFSAIDIPEKARADSFHLALAAWHGTDFLVSWNCTHIVSGRVRRTLEEINAAREIRTPIICTPEELMEI